MAGCFSELVSLLLVFNIVNSDHLCPDNICNGKVRMWLGHRASRNENGQAMAEIVMEHLKKSTCWKHEEIQYSSRCDDGGYCGVVNTLTGSCKESPFKADYQTYDIGRYKLYDTPMNWQEAKKKCESDGAHLAIVDTEAEVAVLKQVFQPSPSGWAFIGFSDIKTEGDYIDVFGNKVKPFWLKGQPDDYKGIEDCGSINREGLLNDLTCEIETSFICEINY